MASDELVVFFGVAFEGDAELTPELLTELKRIAWRISMRREAESNTPESFFEHERIPRIDI